MERLSGNDRMATAGQCQGKVLVVASVASMISQFNIPNIRILLSMGYRVDVACNFMEGSTCTGKEIQDLLALLKSLHVGCYQVSFRRNALDLKAAYGAYKELCRVMQGNAQALGGDCLNRDGERYLFVHAHSPVGGMVGRIAAWRNQARSIYTAHGFHFYDGAPLQNWLLFYPAEKLLGHITDILVSINKEDYRRAKRSIHAGKIAYIPGIGVDAGRFGILKAPPSGMRAALGFHEDDILLLSAVGAGNKGFIAALKAISLLKEEPFYRHIQYLVYGQGTQEEEVSRLASKMGICGHVRFLYPEEDISDVYGCADMFVCLPDAMHAAAPLVEAMAAGLPVICLGSYGQAGNEDVQGPAKSGCRLFVNYFGACCQGIGELSSAIREFAPNSALREKIGADAQKFIRAYGLTKKSMRIGRCGAFSQYRRVAALADRWEIRKKHRIPRDAFVILSVGELNANKNHRVIIEAVALLNDKDIYYIICGQGKKLNAYQRLRKEKGLAERVIFAGFQEEVEKYYHAADVFAFPSKREGLGMAALEAMAAGLPIISSDAGGIRDYSQDGVTGHAVPSGSPPGIYAKAIQEIKEGGAWGSYSRNAMARALQFRQESVDGRMERIYKECGKYCMRGNRKWIK